MSSTITNNSRQALVVPLNSGNAIHLAPGETSDPLDEVEVASNSKIEKLIQTGLIALARAASVDHRASSSADDDDSGLGGSGQATRKKSKS